MVVESCEFQLVSVYVCIYLPLQLSELLSGQKLAPFKIRVPLVKTVSTVNYGLETFQQHQIVLQQIVRKHVLLAAFQDLAHLQKLKSVVSQKINLVFPSLQNLLLRRVFLVFLSHHADRPSNIVLLLDSLILVCLLLRVELLDDLAGLEFFTIKYFRSLVNYREMLFENVVIADVRKGYSVVWI